MAQETPDLLDLMENEIKSGERVLNSGSDVEAVLSDLSLSTSAASPLSFEKRTMVLPLLDFFEKMTDELVGSHVKMAAMLSGLAKRMIQWRAESYGQVLFSDAARFAAVGKKLLELSIAIAQQAARVIAAREQFLEAIRTKHHLHHQVGTEELLEDGASS